MNEKLQYAEMLNIPVNTSTVTYKPHRKNLFKKKKDVEKVKDELISKINSGALNNPPQNEEYKADNTAAEEQIIVDDEPIVVPQSYTPTVSIVKGKKKRREIKVNVIGIELAVIGILAAIICLTSALVPTSGINVFFKEVFSSSPIETVDMRTYEDFKAALPVSSTNLKLDGGIMTISGNTTVYSPCDGKVTDLNYDKETKKFDMVITHNDNFKTVIKGVDYAYSEIGGSVFSNIPVGYVKESATLCFTDGENAVITDYGITDGAVVWAV